jgi:hypothetical protein
MTEPIRLKKDGGILEVLLSRPEAFDALDLDMIGRNVLRPAKAGYESGCHESGCQATVIRYSCQVGRKNYWFKDFRYLKL